MSRSLPAFRGHAYDDQVDSTTQVLEGAFLLPRGLGPPGPEHGQFATAASRTALGQIRPRPSGLRWSRTVLLEPQPQPAFPDPASSFPVSSEKFPVRWNPCVSGKLLTAKAFAGNVLPKAGPFTPEFPVFSLLNRDLG